MTLKIIKNLFLVLYQFQLLILTLLQILVLLDVSHDQEMVDEGMAREIVNRIQKLRKKAHLVPTDQITVYYNILPENSDLNRVAKEHHDFIEVSIRAPFAKSDIVTDGLIATEEQEVSNTVLRYFEVL